MQAVRLHAFGPAENLTYEEVPDLRPGEGQVRIDVRASGVQLLETRLRQGLSVGPHQPPRLPVTFGDEVAGIVDAVGNGVAPSWLGRRVVTQLTGEGGYAEHALADVASLHHIPDGLDEATATAMITTGATATGLFDLAHPTADDVVLIMSAAGGIGNLLVQAAHAAGAMVVGVAGGPDKVKRVAGLGADLAVDCHDGDWPQRVATSLGERQVSIAFDGVGGRLGRQALELLGSGSRLLLHGWASGKPTDIATADIIHQGLTVTWTLGPHLMPNGWRALEAEALRRAASGHLTPVITEFPLSEASAAHTALESRATQGKVVLVR